MATALLYGANGYTGRLIARLAHEHGIRPIIAGRSGAAVASLARELELEHRVFALDVAADAARALDGVTVVLNCAGPFFRTATPLATACIRRGVHYLDVTGEIDVFEALARRHEEARAARVMLLPGAGFDVVPSDCLALHLARRLPSATHLTLGISGTGRLSHGTASTMVEHAGQGGAVRRDGKIVRVPTAWRTREIDFGEGPRTAVTIPWGDVATAWYSTGIPNIEVYAAAPGWARPVLRVRPLLRRLEWFMRLAAFKRWRLKRIRAGPAGPSEQQLREGRSVVWGRVHDAAGNAMEARVDGPNGYLLTAHCALLILRRVLAGDVVVGFQTPSLAYGPDFVLEAPGVSRPDAW